MPFTKTGVVHTVDVDDAPSTPKEIIAHKLKNVTNFRNGEKTDSLYHGSGWKFTELPTVYPYIKKLTTADIKTINGVDTVDDTDENKYFYYEISSDGTNAWLIEPVINWIGAVKQFPHQAAAERLKQTKIIFQVEKNPELATVGGRRSRNQRRSRKSRKQRKGKSRRSRR